MKVSRILVFWSLFAAGVAAIRIFASISPSGKDALCTIYALGSSGVIGIPGVIASQRLIDYLYANHRSLWTYLTSMGQTHLGYINGFRALPWIIQPDSASPADLAPFRRKVRQFQKLVLLWAVTTPFFCLALSL
jgi:hypothetical protein